MALPKISVIVPVYNVKPYLKDCIESVLSQTFYDFELILVDDGSNDGSEEILKKYENQEDKIQIICQKNLGVSAARNVGLEKSKGEYICFLDGDDELAPKFLEKMLNALIQTGSEIVSGDIQQGEERGKWIDENPTLQVYLDPFEEYMQGKLNSYAAIWGKIYKKEAFKNLDFKAEISQGGEDLFYLYQALYQAKKMTTTSEKLYFYRSRPNSVVTSKLSERFVLGNIKTAELLADYFKDKELTPKTRKILNQKIAKRIFKFAILEPKRKDKENLGRWYALTRPLLARLKEKGIYQPMYLTLKNQLKSWWFLKGEK